MGALQIINEAIKGGKAASTGLKAADRAAAGRAAAELIKSQEQIKASEALGQLMEKGVKRTTTTQADRTRVGGGNIGGAPFSAISEADPNYAGKVWGVMDEGTAARLKNLTDPETAWTTMLGSSSQLKTNPIVFDKLKRGFVDSMKAGNLSDELAAKINHNLGLTFGEGADIRDPSIWKQADTFDKRAALADLMMGKGIAPKKGGVALGGEKSGKGVIFRPSDILIRETEQSLLHPEHGGEAPTFAAGPRLFRIDKESEFRPDLHPGFPTLLTGKDYNINMKPTPTEAYLPDWHREFKKNNPDRKAPGYYDLALGVKGEGLPSQELNDEYIRHLLREGFAEGGEVHADFHDKLDSMIEAHMADGGEVSDFDSRLESMIKDHHNTLPDIEPAQEAPIANVTAHKQHMGNQDISRTGVSAGMNLGDMGRVGGGMNMTNVMTGKDAQLMKELMAYYSNNVGNANINANLIKPMGGNNTLMNLMGSMPVGEGRVSMGLHGSNQDGRNQLNARSVGYQTPMGGGHFNANINSPVHGSPSANVNFTKQFADGGAAFGVFPQAKPRRAHQDREAAKNVPVDLARGITAGALGAPGDLESLVRMLPYLDEKTILPTSEEIEKRLPFKSDTPVSRAATGLGSLAGGFYTGPGAPIRVVGALPSAIKRAGQDFAKASVAGAPHVVKPTGGNWLGGKSAAVESQLGKLKMGDTSTPEWYADRKRWLEEAQSKGDQRAVRAIEGDLDVARRNDSMNAWIDSNLKNYVKKEMGTEADPVRKLAEQGVLHMEPFGNADAGRLTMKKRAALGYPYAGVGQSEKAKFWERLSDQAIDSYPAGSYKHGSLDESLLEANPWLQKVPDETMIHTGKGLSRELGFDHIIDVLREDVRGGRIRPEQLNKVSMEQAVRRVHEYDQEMARKMAETQAKVTEGMPVHKEYPDKGYKWIELKAPNYNVLPLEERKQIIARLTEEARQKGLTPEDYIEKYPENQLSEALKYEGNTMGHCVGNYCPDVLEGKSRIYSLRDTKGEPHVTIEVEPPSIDDYAAANQSNPYRPAMEKIIQIKGKQNAAPKEEYLPYVQDFVKSGSWSDVGDFRNTGLIKQDGQLMTPTEHSDWLLKQLGTPPVEGMKRGGKVNIEQEYKFKKFRK